METLTSRALFSAAKLVSVLHMGLIRKKHSIGDIYFLVNRVAGILKSGVLENYLSQVHHLAVVAESSEQSLGPPGFNPPSRRTPCTQPFPITVSLRSLCLTKLLNCFEKREMILVLAVAISFIIILYYYLASPNLGRAWGRNAQAGPRNVWLST